MAEKIRFSVQPAPKDNQLAARSSKFIDPPVDVEGVPFYPVTRFDLSLPEHQNLITQAQAAGIDIRFAPGEDWHGETFSPVIWRVYIPEVDHEKWRKFRDDNYRTFNLTTHEGDLWRHEVAWVETPAIEEAPALTGRSLTNEELSFPHGIFCPRYGNCLPEEVDTIQRIAQRWQIPTALEKDDNWIFATNVEGGKVYPFRLYVGDFDTFNAAVRSHFIQEVVGQEGNVDDLEKFLVGARSKLQQLKDTRKGWHSTDETWQMEQELVHKFGENEAAKAVFGAVQNVAAQTETTKTANLPAFDIAAFPAPTAMLLSTKPFKERYGKFTFASGSESHVYTGAGIIEVKAPGIEDTHQLTLSWKAPFNITLSLTLEAGRRAHAPRDTFLPDKAEYKCSFRFNSSVPRKQEKADVQRFTQEFDQLFGIARKITDFGFGYGSSDSMYGETTRGYNLDTFEDLEDQKSLRDLQVVLSFLSLFPTK